MHDSKTPNENRGGENPLDRKNKIWPSGWLWLLLLVWFGWVAGIWVHGANPLLFGRDFDFEKAGQFGDAFGSLASLMATIAAIGAWTAVRIQSHELSDARREARARKADEESQRIKATFFQMFQQVSAITSATVAQTDSNTVRGQEAFKYLAAKQRDAFGDLKLKTERTPEGIYIGYFINHSSQIANFFRFVYHGMMLIERLADKDESLFLHKLMYSQFSNDQLLLLVANHALHPKGRNALEVTRRLQLLHNTDFATDLGLYDAVLPHFGEAYFGEVIAAR